MLPVSGAAQLKVSGARRDQPLLTLGQPEIPQAALARLGLEALADFLLALGVGPAVAALADLGLVLVLQRHDLLADHGAHLLHQRLHLGRHAEVHGALLRSGLWVDCNRSMPTGQREADRALTEVIPVIPASAKRVGGNPAAINDDDGVGGWISAPRPA
jgi:hypothetical protein